MATGASSIYLAAANVVYLPRMHTLDLFYYSKTFSRFNLFMLLGSESFFFYSSTPMIFRLL